MDFRPATGGVTVYDKYLEGRVWADNIGWVNVGPGDGPYGNTGDTDYGVNNARGDLSGYGWSETVGWIDFDPEGSKVMIDAEGNFSGYAWNKNIGWTNFSA